MEPGLEEKRLRQGAGVRGADRERSGDRLREGHARAGAAKATTRRRPAGEGKMREAVPSCRGSEAAQAVHGLHGGSPIKARHQAWSSTRKNGMQEADDGLPGERLGSRVAQPRLTHMESVTYSRDRRRKVAVGQPVAIHAGRRSHQRLTGSDEPRERGRATPTPTRKFRGEVQWSSRLDPAPRIPPQLDRDAQVADPLFVRSSPGLRRRVSFVTRGAGRVVKQESARGR